MAKQSSHLTLKGTIGEVTYVQTPDGFYVRRKNSISKKRFATDPAFEAQRENNAEFTRAAAAGKLIRESILAYVEQAKERTTSRRLTALLMQLVKADSINESGKRKVLAANIELLRGFNFNDSAIAGDVIKMKPVATLTRGTGEMQVDIPAFVPTDVIGAPESATHFQFVVAGMELDFDNNKANAQKVESIMIPYDSTQTAPLALPVTVTAGSTLPLLLVFGIRFFRSVNGVTKIIKGKSHNVLVILEANGS